MSFVPLVGPRDRRVVPFLEMGKPKSRKRRKRNNGIGKKIESAPVERDEIEVIDEAEGKYSVKQILEKAQQLMDNYEK